MQLERPPGSPVGFGAVIQGDLLLPNGNLAVVYGSILVADAAKVAADPAAQACDPGAHLGVWDFDLAQTGVSDTHVPVFVDAGDTPDAAYRLQLCPPATLGETGAFAFSLPAPIVTEPTTTGSYLWRALITPADAVPAFEVRAVVPLPQSLGLHASYNARTHTATVSGVATELGQPKAGETILIDADSAHAHAHLDPVTTDAAGRYSARLAIKEQTDFTASAQSNAPTPVPGARRLPEPDRLGAARRGGHAQGPAADGREAGAEGLGPGSRGTRQPQADGLPGGLRLDGRSSPARSLPVRTPSRTSRG